MTFFEKADILPPLSIFNKGYLSHIIIIYFNLITNIKYDFEKDRWKNMHLDELILH